MKIMGIYNELHPGITMHKIPVKAGFPGVLFTIGMAAVFLMGIPALIYFLVLACVLGIGVAVMLRFIPREAGRVGLIFTAIMLVWLVGIPGVDEWRQEHEIDVKDLSAAIMAPPPPPEYSELPFRCDCRQPIPKQPCDSTTRRHRKGQKKPKPQTLGSPEASLLKLLEK